MVERDRETLGVLLNEIDLLETIIKGLDKDAFMANEEKKRAVGMVLINIGELIKLLSPQFKESVKNIPYQKIIAMRNVSAHVYFALNFGTVWNTITKSIPELKSAVSEVL